MYKKILFLALFPFLFSGFIQPLFAQENIVFGSAVYERSAGKPITEKITFTSPTSGTDFMMKIHNGDDHGNHRVSSGTVTLNGIQIAGPSDFNQSIEWIERTVSINSMNELSVNLASPPGSFITITIVGVGFGPGVSISASPETIQTGESSTLSWSSSNAETATIDQGIGDVPVDGSITVSTLQTTTYTITVTGPGGTATASVTVTVIHPPPTVSISANPETIQIGESAVLTWSSTNANSCVIEPGIGSVQPVGSITVSPAETITYTITVTGPGGTATAGITVAISPISISITSPNDCDTISRPETMVQGAIINPLGSEIGINVNGILAIVYGNQFVANHVPLEDGETIITATATDTDGNTATASIIINAVTTGDYIMLAAGIESGISPLETTLTIEGSFSFTESSLTYMGPDQVEFLESTSEEYRTRMTTEGVYFLTAEVTNDESNIYTDTIAIQALDEAELDALLRAKWEGMKTALSQNDIDDAVSYFSSFSKENYREMFTILSDNLTQIEQELGDIQFAGVMKHSAKYDIRITRDGNEYSFYLLFVRDEEGLWKIRSF